MQKQFLFSCYIDKVKFNQEKKNMKMKYFGKKDVFLKGANISAKYVVYNCYLWLRLLR